MNREVIRKKLADFFKTYEYHINNALKNKPDFERMAGFYSEEFIAASPYGVKTGINNEELKTIMDKEFQYSRSIGTKKMECKEVRIIPLDDQHTVAHTEWVGVYQKEGEEISIPFDLHYLVQFRDDQPAIFGWIAGDEQQLLQEKGII